MFSPPPPGAPEEFEPWVPEHSKNLCSTVRGRRANRRGLQGHSSTSTTKKRPIFGTATIYRPSKFCGAVLLCLGCDAVLLLCCDALLLLGCDAVRLKVCMRCP